MNLETFASKHFDATESWESLPQCKYKRGDVLIKKTEDHWAKYALIIGVYKEENWFSNQITNKYMIKYGAKSVPGLNTNHYIASSHVSRMDDEYKLSIKGMLKQL